MRSWFLTRSIRDASQTLEGFMHDSQKSMKSGTYSLANGLDCYLFAAQLKSPAFAGLFIRAKRGLLFQQDSQHTPQRFGRTPQELVAHGECIQVLRPHIHLAQTPDRDGQSAGYSRWRQLTNTDLTLVGNNLHPVIGLSNDSLDIRQRYVPVQLDGQRLAMAAHRTNPHTGAIDWNWSRGTPQDLVGFRLAFPFFTALAIIQLLVDPGDQAARQRHAEVVDRESG